VENTRIHAIDLQFATYTAAGVPMLTAPRYFREVLCHAI
jgi:hypothetical protein